MANLCPLCLNPLTEMDSLEARCATHPARKTTFSGVENPPTLCPEPGCETGLHLGFGDLLCRHIGCAWGRNPFWDGKAVSVQRHVIPPGLSVSEPVSHWEVQALDALATVAVEEMWFPARLLIPADRRVRRARRITLVSLCGAKNVGKTFIAMHALDRQGVPTTQGDFIYCYPPATHDVAAASVEFLQTLRLREMMANNADFTQHLGSTATRPRNVKVSFFTPDRAAVASEGVGAFSRSLHRVRHAVAGLGHSIRDSLTDQVHALMLYDISGEAADLSFSTLVNEHDRRVDIVAVMISAEHLPGGQPGANSPDSLPAALNRLRSVGSRKKNQPLRCALLVTKSDLWKATNNRPLTEAVMREQLHASTDASARELLGHLTQKVVDRIFFIYPDNPAAAAPEIIGLSTFASWCATGR